MEFLRVGQFVNTHGIRGEVKIRLNTDFPEQRFAVGKQVWLQHPKLANKQALTIAGVRKHKSALLIRFQEWTNINQAEPFKGAGLFVPEEEVVSDEEDGFFFHQIIGCQVVTTEGEQIGRVKEILTLPANDVWVVSREGKGDLLLPYIEDVIKEVDVKERVVTMKWMEGLE
ncbi:ribosome maturation factor RimM [Shimazuella sp. AN120528]|uniref:ribosome maturation factor RimM n=1 Tax=Shimazuella soli TaxID=1892854 RepID=UPI001F0DAA7A|nr:ribosome maturation factor RimM [Shimazuella soli]MCH5584980.1 ribosome maturation factor RimM [Shimazuella soli]